ncbi:ubiquitin carboxyl-terminal hydrolase 3 [Pundamilia nyererei]|uniref:Ubiquitin carboxyl-terminal hydrolase n=1 Tax=Pundamilia nyererei TaxID=303518 RepID=A0A9Y3QWN1_9CICH|nr:PREDICTED: ubiquitin carboxyl-terminal hydrolase 3 [Pundamilia nyererei]
MECPHLSSNISGAFDSSRFPNGTPSSWCCNVCRSNKSPWICLTCLMVHCGRYVNGHAKKHFEENQVLCVSQRKGEKHEKEKIHHSVCMDCSSYSVFCYRCDEFVVNDTKLGQVQKLREHLQSLENSALMGERQRKRKLQDSPAGDGKLLKDSDGVALGATGLRNLGNTCFMNAILQSLSNIEQFSCYFKELPAVALRSGKTAGRRMYHTRSQGDNSVSLVEEFRKTLCSLWQGNQTAFSPDSLFYAIWKIMPSFRGYQQQDAHEFMRYLLDHLHRELQYSRNGASHPVSPQDGVRLSSTDGKCCTNGTASVVTSIFGGILQNEVNCLICGTESRKFDPFLDLSLDIPSQFRQKRNKDQEPVPTCTLRGKFLFVACIHFQVIRAFPQHFPFALLFLQPEKSLPGSCLYDLVAVVVHHGSGVGSGHYTAYGSHEGHWYHFNDSTVTLTNEDTVRKAKAYILFYVERTGQVPSDTSASNSTATNKPAVDAAAVDSVSPEIVSQDTVVADTVATDLDFADAASSHEDVAGEKEEVDVNKDMATLAEGDTVSVKAAADADTSDKAATEESHQALQTVAQ